MVGDMVFMRIKEMGSGRYFYIVENHRRGDKVRQKVLEYLGRDPDAARLRRALRYWGVKRSKKK